ncbi:hypothetical protein ABID22_003526 [Pontibacter aydingkolensis]
MFGLVPALFVNGTYTFVDFTYTLCYSIELALTLSLIYVLFHFILWCPQGREAPSLRIALSIFPLLLRRNASLALVTGNLEGAQRKD